MNNNSQTIKYTTDGKKVLVIGKLNSEEKIVQEIFCVDGSEFPSGEHFVVKSLHDFPATSWKEKRIEEIEKKYEEQHEKYNNLIEEDYRKYKKHQIAIKTRLKELDLNKKTFELLEKYLSGNITHLVKLSYGGLEISEINKDEISDHGIKLLTLFGGENQNLTWRLNNYTDGSGCNEDVFPCFSYDEAIEKAKEIFYSKLNEDENYLNINKINSALKYNIDIPKKYLEKYYLKSKSNKEEEIVDLKKRMNEKEEELKIIINKLKKLE